MRINISTIWRSFDLKQVGMCPTCMRISFLAMSVSWVLAAGSIATDIPLLKVFTLFTSSALTMLWFAHVFMRAERSSGLNQPEDRSRRVAIQAFARAVIGAAVMSTGALLPWQGAHADSGCGGWAGNSGCRNSCGSCQRQDSNCNCHDCRSCGSNCDKGSC